MGVFDEIYAADHWEAGSGLGSLPGVTTAYRDFIQNFLRERSVRSVVDLGCGDWQFSRLVDWSGVDYVGVDVVESVIEQNRREYGSDTVRFQHGNASMSGLPEADLLITKDVLQHLPNEAIDNFVENVLPNYKMVLVTNCVRPIWRINYPIEAGGFRPVDLSKKPYGLKTQRMLSFHGPWHVRKGRPVRWRKHTHLIEGAGR